MSWGYVTRVQGEARKFFFQRGKSGWQSTPGLPPKRSHAGHRDAGARKLSHSRARPSLKVLYKAHAYLGIICILPFLIIASSGILLGFYDQLRYSAPPYSLTAPVQQNLAPAALAGRIQAAYPDYRLARLYLPAAPDHAARAILEGSDSRQAFVHPGTGAIFAMQSTAHQDWLGFIYDLHRGKTFGLAGQIIASLSGVGLLILWGAGLMLWWRRPSRAYSWRGQSFRTRLRSAHRWLGLALGGLLAFLAAAGALLNFAGPIKQWLDPAPQIEAIEAGAQPPLHLTQLLARGSGLYPEASLERIYFPAAENPLLRLRFDDGAWVYLHAASGEIIKTAPVFSHWTNLLYPLHSGRLWGTGGPWMMAALGVILFVLGGSGILIYWRNRA